MREILFRAKRMDNGGWVEGYYFCMTHTDGRHVHHFIIPLGADLSKGTGIEKIQVEIDPETLCRYTGLKDKNGKRIWENDIVDASEEWWSACGPAGHNSPIIKVEWLEGVTGFDPFANYDCDCGVYIDANGCEVIGNIFDNPELLKGE